MVLCSVGVSHKKMLWTLAVDDPTYPYVVGGDKCLYFFRPTGSNMERVKGAFGLCGKVQPLMSAIEGHPWTGAMPDTKIRAASIVRRAKRGSVAAPPTEAPAVSPDKSSSKDAADVSTTAPVVADTLPTSCTIITGTVSGHVYVWLHRKIVASAQLHDGAINALTLISSPKRYVTGK